MYYLVENPWPLAGLFLLLALLAFAHHHARGARWSLLLGWLFWLLAAVPLILAWWIPTPTKEVNALLDQLVGAALRHDEGPILKAISPRYADRDMDHARLAGLIEREFRAYTPQSLRLNGRVLTGNAKEVVASFVAVTSGRYGAVDVNYYVLRLKVTFAKEADGWKITRIQRFDPVNADQEIPLLHH